MTTSEPTRYVALLRGVNVGGRNKVPMPTLRDLLTSIGGTEVRTHLHSGNAVFTHTRQDPDRIAADLEAAITTGLGLAIHCMVRSAANLRRVVEANPFPMEVIDGSRFLVVFLGGPPPLDKLATLDTATYAPDEFRVGEREIYAHFPHMIRDSKLAARLSDRWLGVPASSRNWNTVTTLLTMAEAG